MTNLKTFSAAMMATIIALSLAGLPGCSIFGGFRPTEIQKHPDAPMLITKVSGRYARVSIYDSASNRMIEYGWVKVNENFIGWTLGKYDWAELIRRQNMKRPRSPDERLGLKH